MFCLKNNIYLKSMFRQPVRSFLLMLLIASASFAFVVRAVEYIVIHDRITEISGFFQNIGELTHREGATADVSQAIEFIADSPYIQFYDRRRGFEGNLVGMHNAFIEGSRLWRASWISEYMADDLYFRPYIDLIPQFEIPGLVSGDSFFYGKLLDIVHVYTPPFGLGNIGFYPHKILYVEVDHALVGYPDRLFEGQVLRLRMDFPEEWDSPLEDMQIGQRYFLWGKFYFFLDIMQLDSRTITKFIQELDENIWYVNVQPGETVDTAELGLCDKLDYVRHVQSAVFLRTSKDMTAMPTVQEGEDLLRLMEGRFINHDDYLNSRPVVVVHRRFADMRNVRIGDTITIDINASQHLVYSPYYLVGNVEDVFAFPVPITIYPELAILSSPGAYPYITLELEVVGIFELFRLRPVSTIWSSVNKYMFIPDSLIPSDWGLKSAYFGEIRPDYTPAIWYSFMLRDPKDQPAFLWQTRDTLAEMGFRVNFAGRDGSGFWSVANNILLSALFNLIMFSAVLACALGLTIALFMWQRNKDYAILRSLGCPLIKIFYHSIMALLVFGTPALMAGSVAGWYYAVSLTEDALAGFGDIIASSIGRGILPSERNALIASYLEITLPISWLFILCAIILISMLFFVFAGSLIVARRPVLLILQEAK